MDVLGRALTDYTNDISEIIKVIVNGNVDDSMLAEIFFRKEDELNDIESLALEHSKGDILDIGAAAGCHSLILQENYTCDALEISSLSCEVMRKRGVKNVINKDIFNHSGKKYDTILLLMNGFGLTGSLNKTIRLLQHLKSLLKDGGQIIGDSTDIKYMFINGPYDTDKIENNYYGETIIELQYKGDKSIFPWLYVDAIKMEEIALFSGFNFETIATTESHQYLARLTKN